MNVALQLSEQDFVARLQDGNEEACSELVHEHTGYLLAVARRILRHEEDASDAVQDAFASAFKNISRFGGGSTLRTWLHRIVVNACLMRRRSNARRPTSSLDELLPTFDETGHHTTPVSRWTAQASDQLLQEERREQLYACLDQLPDDYREIILMRDIRQLDTAEVATMLNVSSGLVKTRLHRARMALRTLLDQVISQD